MRVVVQASYKACVHTTLDYNRRLNWDEDFFDYRMLYQSQCKTRRRMYYTFRSPSSFDDRDFYLNEHRFIDYPEPGMFTIFNESMLPNDAEMPEQKNRVRVNVHIFGGVMKPYFDSLLNKEITQVFFVS